MTDIELDTLVRDLGIRGKQDREMTNHYVRRMEVERVAARNAIRTLRADLAEAREQRDKAIDLTGAAQDRMIDALDRLEAANARADRAESERDAWRDQCRDPLLGSFAKALEDHRGSIPVAIWSHIDALQKQIDYSANGKYGPVYSGPMVDAAFARADRAEAALAAQIEADAGIAYETAHHTNDISKIRDAIRALVDNTEPAKEGN